MALTPQGHPDRGPYLSNLSGTLRTRHGRTGSAGDIERAVETSQQAADATPAGHPDPGGYLSNLAGALRDRFGATEDLADLDQAVTVGRESVETTPEGHPERAGRLTNLAVCLRDRYGWAHDPADLEEAIRVGRLAVAALPPGHPDHGAVLTNLGLALRDQFRRTGNLDDLDAAGTVLTEAAASRTAPARVRAAAARQWGRIAAAAGRWPEAADTYASAVTQLALMAPRSVTRSDQEFALGTFAGLASAAVACSLRVDDVDRAVVLWEQGRGVLLGQALDARTDLTDLTEAHPGLARQFAALRDLLDTAGDPGQPETGADRDDSGSGADGRHAGEVHVGGPTASDRRRVLADDLDRLVDTIRQAPGFNGFLLPPPAAELRRAASGGPVVLVNSSPVRCDAIVVTQEEVDVVPLPALNARDLRARADEFLDARGDTSREARRDAESRLLAMLGWLWDTIAEPVLDHLGIASPPPPGHPWPRLWWCPSGPLAFLPLHAAGYHDTRGDPRPRTVMDRVVSSYTPTVRALTHARRPHFAADSPTPVPRRHGIAVVAMRQTPGARDLPGAAHEVGPARL